MHVSDILKLLKLVAESYYVLQELAVRSSNVAVGAVITLVIRVLQIPAFISLEYFFRFLGAFAKFRKATISLVLSAHRPPLDGFSLNLIFEYFSKIFGENSSFIKILQEYRVHYMKTYAHLC